MKDTSLPAKWAMGLIGVYFVIYLLGYGVFFYIGTLAYSDTDLYFRLMNKSDAIERVILVSSFVCYFSCGIFFAIWTYRTHANFKAFSERVFQDYESSTAAICYFIPLVNLYLPYKIVTENWDNFQHIITRTTGIKGKDNPFILPWWLFFILASLIERIGSRFMDNANDMDLLVFALIVLSIRLVAGILAVIMIKRFMQTERQVVELMSAPKEGSTAYESLIVV